MKRLRIAVIGAGHLGRIHARLVRTLDEVQLVGIVDPVREARESAAAENETVPFADLEEVIGGLDAAILASPTSSHFEVARHLLESRIHVLVEKPITPTASEARDLVRLAQRRRRVLQVGHVERFNPAWNAVRGRFGRVLHIEARRECRHSLRSTDIGVVHDLMIHDIDLALSIAGGRLTEVRAAGFAAFGDEEDSAAAWLSFDNGVQAQLTASRVAFAPQRTMRVVTDAGWADIDFASGAASFTRPGEQLEQHVGQLDRLTPDERRSLQGEIFPSLLQRDEMDVPSGNAILDELYDFVISIRSRRPPMVSGEAGLAAVDAAERICAAMSCQTWRSFAEPAAVAMAGTPGTPPAIEPSPTNRRRAG